MVNALRTGAASVARRSALDNRVVAPRQTSCPNKCACTRCSGNALFTLSARRNVANGVDATVPTKARRGRSSFVVSATATAPQPTEEANGNGKGPSGKSTGFFVKEVGLALEAQEYSLPELGDYDVDIGVTHNGLCHTDIHMRDNDWGVSTFPFVPGHEVVGKVIATGPKVTGLKVGDRVGYGWIRGSCRVCGPCLKGQENLCHSGYSGTILGGNNGGFQTVMRAPADFAFKLPDALDSVSAAPLLCAGITVFAPLKKHITRPGMKVGVMGVGGLGHLALQFADALGAEVYAISGSPSKEEECRGFGASHFVMSKDADQQIGGQLDLIINTISGKNPISYSQQMGWLRNDGTLCLVGLPVDDISVPVLGLVFGQKKLAGSIVGGRSDMVEMLELAAVKQIKPMCETMPLSKVNEAMDKVAANEARYRIVLTTDFRL